MRFLKALTLVVGGLSGVVGQCYYSSYSGDGYCDSVSNSGVCDWDGGDCCESTCADSVYTCGSASYDCTDPTAPDYTQSFPNCDKLVSYIGDGYCDSDSNSAACDWDGGDCCESTCVESVYTCGVVAYACADPSATDYAHSYSSSCTAPSSYIGDGYCDSVSNYAVCDWDGGDCCESTCADSVYTCGSASYNCTDPTAPDYTQSFPDCDKVVSWIGDGYCDSDSNSAACDWDGGDCCESTCAESVYACGVVAYTCADPSATDYDVATTIGISTTTTSIAMTTAAPTSCNLRLCGSTTCSELANKLDNNFATIDKTFGCSCDGCEPVIDDPVDCSWWTC